MGGLSEFDKDPIVMSTQLGQNIPQTVALMAGSQSAVVTVDQKCVV